MIPKYLAYFWDWLDKYLPSKKPNRVKLNDKIENIDDDIRIFVDKYSIPKPIVKLSNDTKKAKTIILIMLSSYSFLVSLILFIISNKIKNKIMIKINFDSRLKYSIIILPTKFPNMGIIKWNNPTTIEVDIIVFLDKFKSPYASDKLKASILRDNPIIIIVIICKKVTY